ncbi:MAG: DNA-3-methyladenine glycosylase I [Sneathiella sp.]|nr:DNA-3-methyladenine glycosylase I [Sneathiella sp.]
MSEYAHLCEDGQHRCFWCGDDPFYQEYHDTDWGVPEYDSRALFEKLILDGFQAGLSWITILRKRDAFREVFDGFQPEIIAHYDAQKVEQLMADTRIVRNRAKIEGTILSARQYLEIQENEGSFADYLWKYVDGKPLQNDWQVRSEVPAQTALSQEISKDLKKRGFKFVGPTIVYAFMQAVGMVNDHQVDCFRHAEVKKLSL